MVSARAVVLMGLLFAACGGFENEPLLRGGVRGQLEGGDATSFVALEGTPESLVHADASGQFELRDVPIGAVTLLVVVNERSARKVETVVGSAEIVELGVVSRVAAERLEIKVAAPGNQALNGLTATLLGTPFMATFERGEAEAKLWVPAGCFTAQVSATGLGESTFEICAVTGQYNETRVVLAVPDGSPGREGCALSGCTAGLTCGGDRACH